MAMRRVFWSVCGLICWFALASGVSAQDDAPIDLVAMTVEAGYDTHYRENFWFPIRVRVRNQGDPITGRLTVRPETSGRAVSNAYSTPIDLPAPSDKTAFLYVQARTFPNTLLVELIDDAGVRVAEQEIVLNPLAAEDALHVVISGAGATSIPLNQLATAGKQAVQARWEVSHVPDHASALLAINSIVLYDVDTTAFTTAQRQALTDWLTQGGYLVVIGGANWQPTAAALTDLLPFVPDGSQTSEDLSSLARLVGDTQARLDEPALITTGAVRDGARVLAAAADGTPLVIRGTLGAGTVDYLVADPTLAPLTGWEGLAELWVALYASRPPHPAWRFGFLDTEQAATAVAILPGIDLLPPVSSMIGYIGLYILLVGPVNYLVLSRLRRTGLAWFTIPLLIFAFSGVAWSVGFNLRGSDIIISRLNVVQSHADSDTARVDQLVGILSPRRETYALAVTDDHFLRLMPELSRENILQQNLNQSALDIRQHEQFNAEGISIDGGIFANFSTSGTTSAPAISGEITRTYQRDAEADTGTLAILGAVRNESAVDLHDPIIMVSNHFYRLEGPIAAGELVTFDTDDLQRIALIDEDIRPQPSPAELSYDYAVLEGFRNRQAIVDSRQSARLLLGDTQLDDERLSDPEVEQLARRSALALSFMRDQYDSQGLGAAAYLLAWSDLATSDVVMEAVNPVFVDTALHIVELASRTDPSAQRVTLSPDQFSWAITARNNAEGGINELTLINESAVVVRFMPLPDAILSEVESLTVALNRNSSYGRDLLVSVWDWQAEAWVELGRARESITLDDPAGLIGPHNWVDVRVSLDRDIGTPRANDLRITQTGRF